MSRLTKALAMALAGTKCGTCGGTGGQEDGAGECDRCHGTGFLLDTSVRVPCHQIHIHTLMAPDLSTIRNCTCAEAGCRGWTAPEDFVQWCWALAKVGVEKIEIDLQTGAVQMYGYAVRGNEWWADAEAVLTALAGVAEVTMPLPDLHYYPYEHWAQWSENGFVSYGSNTTTTPLTGLCAWRCRICGLETWTEQK